MSNDKMIEEQMATESARTAQTHRDRWWVTLSLVAVAILITAGSFLAAAPAPEGEEAFAGADGASEEIVAEISPEYEPWVSPVFEVESGEVESGLFAVQAALGAGFVGYAVGRMRSRRS